MNTTAIKTIIVQAGQSLADIALQEYGTYEGVILVLQANPGLSITGQLTGGQELIVFTNQAVNLVKELVKVEPYASQLQSIMTQWLTLAGTTGSRNTTESDPNFAAWLAAFVPSKYYGTDANNNMVPMADPDTFWSRSAANIAPRFADNSISFGNINTIAINIASTNNYAFVARSVNNPAVSFNSVNAAAITCGVSPASTNTVIPLITLQRETTSTAAAGIGGGIDILLESLNTASSIIKSLSLNTKITDITNGFESTNFEVWVRNAGVLSKKMELTGAGELIVNNLKLTNLRVFADNAAAIAGGLVVNTMYRKSTGEVMIVY